MIVRSRNRDEGRRENRGLILKLIATGKCRSRAEIADCTGLSRMSVTTIVSEMKEMGYLIETGEDVCKKERGRNAITLGINPGMPKTVGLLITRDRVEAVRCTVSLQVEERAVRYLDRDTTRESLIRSIYEILDATVSENTVVIGVSSIGPVSSTQGRILHPYYFYDISDVPVLDLLESRYHLPVFVDHDNQNAALVESVFGNWKDQNDLLFVGMGDGIGCGIITRGQRYENSRGLSPEIGHVSIDMNGRICPCGSRGCLETYVRTSVMLNNLRSISGKNLSYQEFIEAEPDDKIDGIFRTALKQLAFGMINVLNIIHSETVIIGNDAIYWKEEYIDLLTDFVNSHQYVRNNNPVRIVKASFGRDNALLGASCNAINMIFKGELLFDKV